MNSHSMSRDGNEFRYRRRFSPLSEVSNGRSSTGVFRPPFSEILARKARRSAHVFKLGFNARRLTRTRGSILGAANSNEAKPPNASRIYGQTLDAPQISSLVLAVSYSRTTHLHPDHGCSLVSCRSRKNSEHLSAKQTKKRVLA